MKCLLAGLIVFVTVVNLDGGKPLFFPQLPVGEYRLKFLGITNCGSTPSNNKIKFNWYLSKKSANTTEIKGNITNITPLDDSLTLEINVAIKDSIGGWKDNAYVIKSPKACSSLKNLCGNAWINIMGGLGVHNATCPIPVGLYVADGLDTDLSMLVNFPKSFFYGTYKVRVFYTRKNLVYGCAAFVLEVKRPWETN